MLDIYIDADGCAVKEEVYKVAGRYDLQVVVVSNKHMRVPASERIRQEVVGQGLDVADDWIAEHIGPGDIVVTADIPLADRCLKKGARAIGPKGREFTDDMIGESLATRALMDQLRSAGEITGGPAAMKKLDRSRFLSKLDELINAVRRESQNAG